MERSSIAQGLVAVAAALVYLAGCGDEGGTPAPVTVSISDVSLAEGDVGATVFSFDVTVSRLPDAGADVTLDWATDDVTAAAGTDYATAGGALTFTSGGPVTLPVTVDVMGDGAREMDEKFAVELTNITGATPGTVTATGTILNDDLNYILGVADLSVPEEDSGTIAVLVPVTLSSPVLPGEAVTVDCSTSDGTATAGEDYATLAPVTLVFTTGEMVKNVLVFVNTDTDVEPHETVSIDLTNASTNAAVPLPSGTLTILNDDAAAGLTLSIDDVAQAEGTGTTTDFVFTVTLSGGLPADGEDVTVGWALTPGTAAAGADFTDLSGTVAFTSAGPATQTIAVPVVADDVRELEETFTVDLSGEVNAAITDAQGIGTIQNDDLYRVNVDDMSLAEGDSLTTPFNVTVRVAPAVLTGESVTVDWATSGDTATEGVDYAYATGTLTFDPGQDAKDAGVSVTGETDVEYDETFHVNLPSASLNATIVDAQGDAVIVSDDLYAFSVDDVALAEGDAGITYFDFTVSVTPAIEATDTATVKWRTSEDTAIAGEDYTAVTDTTLTFTAGQTSQQVTVYVAGDEEVEFMDRFLVELFDESGNATIADAEGVGSIENDDGAIVAHVDPTGDDTDGLSWPTAFRTVQQAADRVSESGGGEIWVAAGTYTNGVVGSTEPVVRLDLGNIELYGGFEGYADGAGGEESVRSDRDWDANETILDGMGTAENVVRAKSRGLDPLTIDGFTITGGNAAGNGGGVAMNPSQTGASAYATIAHCRIVGNSAAGAGGGLYAYYECFFSITGSEFSGNDAAQGGAMAFDDGCFPVDITGCAIMGNTADFGGGMYQFNNTEVALDGCQFSGNSADEGGAAYGDPSASASYLLNMESCLVSGNLAGVAGGLGVFDECILTRCMFIDNSSCAVFADGSDAELDICSCGFVGNYNGGVACTNTAPLNVSNSAFFGNTGLSAAVYLSFADLSCVDSCTFAGNTISLSITGGSSQNCHVTNSIFWGDTGVSIQPDPEGYYHFRNCDIEGCGGSGAGWDMSPTHDFDEGGNIDADPLFVDIDDPLGPDGILGTHDDGLRLRSGSPCIDAGANAEVPDDHSDLDDDTITAEPLPYDLAELPRFAEDAGTANTGSGTPPIVDMGAYEFQGTTLWLSIDDISLAEGDSGDTAFVFTVTITAAPPAGEDVTVDWATADGTATTTDSDYTAASGQLTFTSAGPLTQTVTVQVTGDVAVEGDETFNVDLSNPVNAAILDGQGVGTVQNDD